MGFLQRAFLHTKRKWVKSLLLFGLLLVMATLILTCTSIQSATHTAALNVRQSLRGGFTIDAKAAGGQLTEEVTASILSIEGVKQNYNARSNSYGEYRAENGTPLTICSEGAFEVSDGFEHAGKLMSDEYSEKDALFTEQGFELTAGRHITKGDQNVVLVHKWLAKKNNLTVGDKLTLSLNDKMVANGSYDGQTVTAEIIGIFTNTEPQNTTNMLSHLFYENVVFTDPGSYSRLFNPGKPRSYDYADFQVDDPAELTSIMDTVKKIPGVDWKNCVFIRHDKDYQNAKTSLEALENMVTVMVWVILGVSLFLLILILALWIRERVHETGVFLSMGSSKYNILLQQITEVLIVAALAFLLSYGTTTLVAQSAGNALLNQASASEYEKVNLTEDTGSQDIEAYTELEVTVSMQSYALIWVIGSALCAGAVTLAAFPVLRMKPKNILSQMS